MGASGRTSPEFGTDESFPPPLNPQKYFSAIITLLLPAGIVFFRHQWLSTKWLKFSIPADERANGHSRSPRSTQVEAG